MGAIVFWPMPGIHIDWKYVDTAITKDMQYDTICLVGVESGYETPLVLERLAKVGPIEAVARNQDMRYPKDRVYMWVQYTEWKYAWNAIINLHGRHVGSQDIEVACSNRSINAGLPSARKGDAIWYMK